MSISGLKNNMLNLAIVGNSAESRTFVYQKIQNLISESTDNECYLPTIDLKSVALSELRHQSAFDLIVLTEEVCASASAELYRLTREYVNTHFLAFVGSSPITLESLERLARIGIADTVAEHTNSLDFIRKIIFLSGQLKKFSKRGKLLHIEGAKGGVGVTTLAVSLAEALQFMGQRVVLIDLDFISQNLSRFTYSRPFVNENLSLLLHRNRPITAQSVLEALGKVWSETSEDALGCLSPVTVSEIESLSQQDIANTYLRIFKILDAYYDVIIVDAGSIGGSFLRFMRKIADSILYVMRPEAAAIYSSVQTLRDLSISTLNPEALRGIFVSESSSLVSLQATLLAEVAKSTELPETFWMQEIILYKKSLSEWPLSGGSLFKYLAAHEREIYYNVLQKLNLINLSTMQYAGGNHDILSKLLKLGGDFFNVRSEDAFQKMKQIFKPTI